MQPFGKFENEKAQALTEVIYVHPVNKHKMRHTLKVPVMMWEEGWYLVYWETGPPTDPLIEFISEDGEDDRLWKS